MSANMATLGLLKMKIFGNKGYGIVISFHDVTNNILLRESYYIVDSVIRPHFGDSSISMGLALGITLKFYTSVAKRLKLKVKKFCL